MFVAKITYLNGTCTSIQSCILNYFNKTFILSYLSYLCGSNEHNFVLNGALLTEIFIIYYVFTNLTITQSILTRFLRLSTWQIALINVYSKLYRSKTGFKTAKDRSTPVQSAFLWFPNWEDGSWSWSMPRRVKRPDRTGLPNTSLGNVH